MTTANAESNSLFLIFLPVRNGGRYIHSTIASILSQTVGDWLLYVLENCSSDDTLTIVESFNDPRIRVVPAETDLSIEQNWARIVDVLQATAAAGQIVTMIGHDDLLYPEFLAAIGDLADQHPDATLFQTAFDLIDSQGQLTRPCRPVPETESWVDFLASRCWGLRDSYGTGYAFRAEAYLKVGGIPALPMLLFSDDLLFTRLTALGRKVCTAETRCAYRLHRSSASASVSADRTVSLILALRGYAEILEREFASFGASHKGRAAMAALIAREVSIFHSKWLHWALPDSAKDALDALQAIYARHSPSLPPTAWSGMNRAMTPIYRFLRISFWLLVFGLDHWRTKSR